MKNCNFNDNLVAELETCQSNMTPFLLGCPKVPYSLQIASEVVHISTF